MAGVNGRLIINRQAVKRLDKATQTALEKTAESLHTRVVQSQVMPFDTGTMQNEQFFVDSKDSKKGKVSLVVSTPYARRLYYHPEYNYQTVNNPKAGGHWFDPWINGKQKDYAQKAFKQHLKRERG